MSRPCSADSAQGNVRGAHVGRSQIGAGTSEIRRWLIGRELFEDSK